mgnify:CR=1 FL=1
MLSKTEAKEILIFKYPDIRVESGIDMDGLWVFRAFMPIGGDEENMNPFLSVDKTDGSVNDFSVFASSDPMEMMRLFAIEDGQAVPKKPSTPQAALEKARKRR